MNADSQFLSHIRLTGETVKDWPAWKTEMWPENEQIKPTDVGTSAPSNLQTVRLLVSRKTK